MERQAESERQKRAEILNTEGKRQAEINVAEGMRQAAILTAEGQAKAISISAAATAKSISVLANGIDGDTGLQAVNLRIAEKYVEAYSELAKNTNYMILPSAPNDIAHLVTKAFGIFDNIDTKGIK